VHDEKQFLNGLTRCPPTALQQKIFKDEEIQRDGISRALSFRLKNFPQTLNPKKKKRKILIQRQSDLLNKHIQKKRSLELSD
jgi:hypothetical protein